MATITAPVEGSAAGALTATRPLRIQLWSWNYDPEPSGMGPLAGTWARTMAARGHTVDVVTAHPHHPDSRWGVRVRPYRELRDGIPLLRLPLPIARRNARQRILKEVAWSSGALAALPWLGRPDILVVVSPCFPALVPAMFDAALRRVPWVLWLEDIYPDAAVATGLVKPGRFIAAAARLERAAYRNADRVVVIADSFVANLRDKGVPAEKITRIYNPATRAVRTQPRPEADIDPTLALNMGNVGLSQNLLAVTEAFQDSAELERLGARFVMLGDGLAGDSVRAAIRTPRVEVTGFVGPDEVDAQLARAAVGVVTQHYEGFDFNVPSKLMNFMGSGIPVVASVREDSEVARLLERSGGGWISDSARPENFATTLAQALADPRERSRRGAAALRFAQDHFTPDRVAEAFEGVFAEILH
jgi:colanic acid biosynthesis glycosyl transferase WcaI